MEKVLRLYKYIDGINDIAFPNEKEQAIITSFRYDAKRMGAAPTISFSLMHNSCLDSLWDNKVYALFNGERFYVKQTPTSSYSSSDTRYKHEVELVSERFILDNIYFYDVVSSSSQDKPVSNSSKFSFFGNIKEYVSRINNSLNKSNVGYSIVIDDDILSDEELMSIESQVTFEDQVITNALQEIYNVYKIPYYFVGKTIHVGYYQDNIDTVFKYGCKNSLISISKTNANSKIINKITGVGSSYNIPYYYPNVDEKGITQVLCNGREGIAEITDLVKYRKVKLADKFVFHETIQSLVPLIDENDYSFGDFRDEGIDGDGNQRVSIDFYYSFTLQQYESVEFSVTTTYEDSLDLRYEIFNPSGQYVAYYKEDKRLNLTGGNYQFVIRWSFLSKEPMIGSDDVIKNFVSQYLKVKANIVVDSSNAWTKNNIPVTLSDYGISVNSPSDGDVLTIERLAYIQPQPNLVPPIYRNTEGGERFYEAINGKYKNEQGGYYQFDNEYTPTNPREHIENFDDIKPTIKNVINGSGYYIDEFIDFAYDLDDNDETDESGKFIHPYFFGKLRRFDGEFGFNLFDHAIDEGEMVVSMTSGTCGSCEFVIGVDEQSQKNKVQVDADGNLVRDNNGNIRLATPQDRQNDTKNNEVWIALKKDIQTFGVVMPNVGNNYRPKAGDKFVLLHIDLPQQYVEAAENALKDKLIKYMHENNFEKFNFSIAFSRIYFAENPTILANLSENSKIQIEYNNNIYDLYVSSLSYSISSDSALPEVKVELEDALAISQNQITQVVESTKREIISSIDKNVFWGDIKGVPTWITSDKPRYSYSELSGRGTSDNSNDVWVVKKDAKGNSYVYTKLNVVVERGVTMYGTDGSVDVPSIFDGLPIDNNTIYWDGDVLKSRGVGEGGVTPTLLGDLTNVGAWANDIATEDRIMVQKKDGSSWEALELSKIGGSASFENVKESGDGNAYTSFTLSDDKKTLTFNKGGYFAKQSDHEKIAKDVEGKADKATTLSGYGITNAYTSTEVDSLLEKYLPIIGGTITGNLRLRTGTEYTSPYLYFGDGSEVWIKEVSDTYLTVHADGGVRIDSPATFIDGIKIEKSADGVLYIDADLVVKGGVTMFANEGSYTPSTITDAVSVDNQTIIKQGGKLMVNPELVFGSGGGGEVSTVSWGNIIGKPTWITDTKPVYKYVEISGTPDLSVYAPIESLDNYQSKITTTNKLSYSLIDGTPNLSVYALKSDLNGYQIKITESSKLSYSLIDDTPDLDVYATKGTSLSHYGITDAYTKTNVNSLLSAKWTKDDTKISNWDTAYSWGNHAQAGYFKSADFTKDKIKTTLGISDWALASTKPSYTTKEVAEDTNLYFTNARAVNALAETLKGYVTLSGTQTITGEKNFTGGLKVNGSPIVYNATGKYWKLEGDLLVTGGITMFGNDSSFSPSTITQAVNIDGSTLVRKNGVIMLNPDIEFGGGVADSVAWGNIDGKPSWITASKPEYKYSEIKETPDLSGYAKKATTLSGYGITDAMPKEAYHYISGCLVKLDVSSNLDRMITIVIRGNSYESSYNGGKVINTIVEFYNYQSGNSILYSNATHFGFDFGDISVFNYDGCVCLWFKQTRSYQSFLVEAYTTNDYINGGNIVKSISDSAMPTSGVTRLVTITPIKGVDTGMYTASDVLSKLLTKDGTGSKLDADLLDGQEGSYYASAESLVNYLPLGGGTMTGVLTTVRNGGVYSDDGAVLISLVTDYSSWDGLNGLGKAGIAIANGSYPAVVRTSSDDLYHFRMDTYGLYKILDGKNYSGYMPFLNSASVHATNTSVIYAPYSSGTTNQVLVSGGANTAPSWVNQSSITSGACSGNATTATRLQTARTLWGNSFNGSSDIKNADITLYQNESSYTGGWVRAILSRNSSGDVLGEVGFYGLGESLSYTYLGGRYSSPRIVILADGKVGVGTTTPQYEFDVNGSTRIQGTSVVRNIRPELTNSYSLGDSSYLWANLYTKKANIDGIEIKKSANGVLYIGGNLVVSGGVTMYGTDGTTANTIWDSAPIASTSVKGIASFDSNFFAVNNGKVTFVGQTGGGVADSVAWGNVTGKPTWLGSSKPSYTTSEVAEGTNLYFTNARAVSALSSTLSNYLPLSGGTLTDKLTGTTIVANDLYWREYKNKTLSSVGWYRFATSTRPDSYGNTYILSICRVYNTTSNESYLIAVTLDYSGCSFTQLAGHRYSTAAQLVTKIRCTRTHSGDVYFDFYYTGSSQNTVYVNAIGHCKVQTPEATSSTLTYTDEFILEEGVKSSLGFIGDLKGNADTATSATTATTASKLSTVSKTAWGQTYWTSGGIPTNISGNMSSVGSITPSTHNTYSIGYYGNGFAWSNFNCISSGAVSNNLWLCGGTTSGIGVVIARSNSNTATGELCRFTEQGMVWASGVIPAIVSTAQDIQLKYNNADATSIVFNGASFKPFISASDNIMLGRYDSLWRGLFLSTDASVPRTEKGVTFCSSNGYAEGKIGANSSGIGIYTVGGLYLRGGCTKGANGTMTESSTGAVIDASGNMLVTGGVTMYSDLRKKTILNYVELSLKEVADAPLIEHYYNSDKSKRTHVGSVAQYWAELNDWFCKEDGEGFLTMEIQNAALASAISVARELTRYESKTDKQIKKLKKRIGELEEEIENLKNK